MDFYEDNVFGKRLKKERLKKGLTQEQLAKKFNLAKQTVSNWENGYRIPDTNNLSRLAQFFNVTVDYLLGHEVVEEEAVTYNFEKKKEMIKEIIGPGVEIHFEDVNKVTPEQLRAMKAVWESLKKNGNNKDKK